MKFLIKLSLPILLISIILFLIVHRKNNASKNNVFPVNSLEYVLQLAATNRVELEKVLQYFHDDSLKHKAALFLIENMAYCREEKWQCYRNDTIDMVFTFKPFMNQYDTRKYMDSLNIKYKPAAIIADYSIISSQYLITHIKRAFRQWQMPGNQYLSFEDFTETLLPYRVATEKLADSYSFITTKYDTLFKSVSSKDKLEATIQINNRLKEEIKWNSRMMLYPGCLSCTEMDSLKAGLCNHLANYGLKVFRAAGIATGNDFAPLWGDSDAGHSWNVLYLKDKKIPFAGCGDNPKKFPFRWRAPKIFRRTYKVQTGGIWAYKNKQQEVPPELSDQHRIDVTSEYYETINIEVPLTFNPPKNNNCAFLCVYNNKRWRPVDWGKIDREKNTAVFTNINDSLLYCVMYYNWFNLKPATYPFLVVSSDSIRFLKPKEKLVTLTQIYYYALQPNCEYELMVWENEWKPAGKAFAYPCYKKDKEWIRAVKTDIIPKNKIKYFLDFKNIPVNGLYWLTIDKRPFWMVNGKMIRRFPCKAYIQKELLK